MCQVVEDFIECGLQGVGVGVFELRPAAVEFAQNVSACQRRKWRKKGIVPASFLHYLKSIKAIPRKFGPENDRTVHKLLDLLWEAPERNRAEASEAEHLRVAILKQLDLMPSGTCSAQHIYQKSDLYCKGSKRRVTRNQPRR